MPPRLCTRAPAIDAVLAVLKVLATLFTLLAASIITPSAHAAPYTPASDSDVVERLPLASDPSARRVESLRRQLAARPDDVALRIDIARRYFELAMAQGDPRLVGYAAASIAPLASSALPAHQSSASTPSANLPSAAVSASASATASRNADYWLVHGLIEQYSHNFDEALRSLTQASQLNPQSAEPVVWRAAIYMVQARYAEALADCERLPPLGQPLLGSGCSAYVRATTGQLQAAFDALANLVKTSPRAAPGLLLWQETRLADMASRLQRPELAESYFKSALKLGLTDQYLLGAYADFLLAQQRPQEAITLLADWERSDVLLLRLALAGQLAKHPKAGDWAAQLRERFQAAALRGDRLHEQEAARFELDVEHNTAKALELAVRNYTVQKEPRDAEILLRTALAAKQARAAQPALDWLRSSRYEDVPMANMADQLAGLGATR